MWVTYGVYIVIILEKIILYIDTVVTYSNVATFSYNATPYTELVLIHL